MISNEYQRRLSLAQAHKFEQALGNLDILSAPDGVHPLLRQAERAALESQLETLRHDIREYDALSAGESKEFSIDSLDELPQTLIKARIASGLTQKQLAERLGLKEQQIQRYEATEYGSANWKRLANVARALGVEVHQKVSVEICEPRFQRRLHSGCCRAASCNFRTRVCVEGLAGVAT